MKIHGWRILVWNLIICVVAVVVNAQNNSHSTHDTNSNSEQKKLVCFYHSWNAARPGIAKFSPLNINPHLCTHIVYANADLDNERGLRATNKNIDLDANGYILFTGLKKYNRRLKVLLGIGGLQAGTARFSALANDEKRRAAFPRHAIEFVRQYNFDGINLNWNFPGLGEHSRPTDKENYVALTKALREEIERDAVISGRPKLLLTMSLPPIVDFIERGYNIMELTELLDFMNLLTYDFHLAYEPYVSHHAPLYAPPEFPDYTLDPRLTVNFTINHLIRNGANPKKLILGLPAYGRTYTLFNADLTDLGSPADGQGEQGEYTIEKEGWAFFEICDKVTRRKGWTIEYPNSDAMGPYAYRGNQWISFDDTGIIKIKIKYALDNHLGGILFMSMDMDDFRGTCFNKSYPLIETAREYLRTEELLLSGINNTETVHNALTTPEPPSTPDPDEDPTLSRARITRIIQDMLANLGQRAMHNQSDERISDRPNTTGTNISPQSSQEILPQLTVVDSNSNTGTNIQDADTATDDQQSMPNPSNGNLPEYIKIEDIPDAHVPLSSTTAPSTRNTPIPHRNPTTKPSAPSQHRITTRKQEIKPTTSRSSPPWNGHKPSAAANVPSKMNHRINSDHKPSVQHKVIIKPLSVDSYEYEAASPLTTGKYVDDGSYVRNTNGLKLKLNYSLEIESNQYDHDKILKAIFHST